MPASPAVEAFWHGFAEATVLEPPYVAWAFGGDDTPELATELGCPCETAQARRVARAPVA